MKPHVLVWTIGTSFLVVPAGILALWLWARSLPAQTRTTRTLPIQSPPPAILDLLMDIPRAARGFEGLGSVAPVGDGAWEVRFVMTALTIRPERAGDAVVWHCNDARGYFQARWRFTPAADGAGTRLTLEEDRITHSRLARAWERLMLRPGHYADKALRAVRTAAESAGPPSDERRRSPTPGPTGSA